MNGFLLINKPAGITSYDVIRQIKKCLPPKTKIGHSGTLDPFATGLLIIAIGRQYTKQLNQLIKFDKSYTAEITFGIETDSYDIDGKILKETKENLNLDIDTVKSKLNEFKGTIEQTPPAFSAKKINGVPAYKLAREGKQTELKSSLVTIYKVDLINNQLIENKISVSIDCSKGTYIRSIAHDLGRKLSVGAHLSKLTRTAIGKNKLINATNLNEISETTLKLHLKIDLEQ